MKYMLNKVNDLTVLGFLFVSISSQDNDMLPDGLFLLLAFNLARGSIGGLLRTLQILQSKMIEWKPLLVLLYSIWLGTVYRASDL